MRKKITTIICLMLCICVQGVAQQIKASNEALTEVLQQIQQKTGYRFYWMTDEVKGIKVTIDADAKDMQLLLRTLLAQTNLKYTIHGNKNVFLLQNRTLVKTLPAFAQWRSKKTSDEASELLQGDNRKATSENKIYVIGKPENKSDKQMVELTGVITSFKTGEPVMGVNMVVRKPTWSAAVSDVDGKFVLKVPQGEVDIEMNGIGIIDTHRRLMVYEDGKLNIELEDKMQVLDEVTVTANKRENVQDVQMGV